MSKHEHEHSHRPVHAHEVPTLPPPARWRLIVAGIVIVGFLYFMYQSYDEQPPPAAPAKSGLLSGTG